VYVHRTSFSGLDRSANSDQGPILKVAVIVRIKIENNTPNILVDVIIPQNASRNYLNKVFIAGNEVPLDLLTIKNRREHLTEEESSVRLPF
jgi:hypothetical protein